MKKIIIPILVISLVIGGVLLVKKPQPPATNTANEKDVPQETYTVEQVTTHVDETSCWSIINNNVYDITKMISVHKGGKEKIMSICGKDGTKDFTAMHGSKDKVKNLLATFQIGTLK